MDGGGPYKSDWWWYVWTGVGNIPWFFEMVVVGLEIRGYYTLYQLFYSRKRNKIWENSECYGNKIILVGRWYGEPPKNWENACFALGACKKKLFVITFKFSYQQISMCMSSN